MGSPENFGKLTRDAISIAVEMMRERPWMVLAAPLLAGVPMVLLVNYWLEVAFAERWFRRATGRRLAPLGRVSWEPGKVSS
jgi:hypothetical protein